MANGNIVKIDKAIKITFKLGTQTFTEDFLVLIVTTPVILGNPFFVKHKVSICPGQSYIKFPDQTLQINEIKPEKQPRRVVKCKKFGVYTQKKQVLQPSQQAVLECKLYDKLESFTDLCGVIIPNEIFEKDSEVILTSSLSKVAENNILYIYVLNITDHPITINKDEEIAKFSFLTSDQAEKLLEVDPQLINVAKMSENYLTEINQLIQVTDTPKRKSQPAKPAPEYEKLWFPTPETCPDPTNLSPLQRDVYEQLLKLQEMEKLDPKGNNQDKITFLSKFPWEKSALNDEQKAVVGELLVEFSDIFAKHRFDVGYNTYLKIKLTPERSIPTYEQGPPTPFHLRNELQIELALMHYYGLITTLSQSRYSSPLFAQRKNSGRLRLLIDLRKVNHLLKNDYVNTNFPISNMSDAINYFAGKKLFTKLDCSQAYHCVQMADDVSVQLPAFNFASRTYAYKCLAQGLNKSVTGVSSSIRHYLDPCLASGNCTQFMDDIGNAVTNFEQLVPSLREIFTCIRQSGLKLSPENCEIATDTIKFLGNNISAEGISPEKSKITKFLDKFKMPKTTKQVKRLIGFTQFFRNYIPNLGEKLMSSYKLLKKDAVIETTEEHVKALEVIKKDLMEATNVTLRLPKPGLQYVILCDASYHGAGFVLMVEDYVNETGKKEKKTYAPVSFGSHLFNATQFKFSIYYKEFLALYYALDYFSHYIWGSSKQVIILTDNKSLTQFFQSKVIPPSLWNCLDRILAFNIVIAHIPGRANYAADFLSRMENDKTATMSLKLTDRIPVKEIEIDTEAQNPDVELNVLFDTEGLGDEINEDEVNFLKKLGVYEDYKKRQNNVPITEIQGLLKLKRKHEINSIEYPNPLDEFPDLTDNLISLNLADEQQKDADIRIVISWIQQNNQQPDLKYATTNLKKYQKHLNRLILEGNVLYRNFYDDTGNVLHKQFCVPKHLWKETIYRLHNSQTAGHLGIKATIQEFRKRFYYPGFTEHFISFIKNCLTCLQLNRVPKSHITAKLQPVSSLQSYPGDMLQIDLVGPLKSSQYKYVLSGIDVFTKYLFAVPLTNGYADTVAKELVKVFFQHSYIPQTILSDLGTNFTSELMSELASLLEVKLKHASLKHPQTIGAVERSHGPLKRILKLNTEEQWKDWHKNVPLYNFYS